MSDPVTPGIDDGRIRAVVTRLARRRADGSHVIERAAILAAGSDSVAIETWILDHAGRPERNPSRARAGLHGHRVEDARASSRSPLRFLLPPGALDGPHDQGH
jgi:hypothetical protein